MDEGPASRSGRRPREKGPPRGDAHGTGPVESNTDDWNGRRSLLGETGSAILPVGVGALLMAGIGAAVVMVRRRKSAHDDTDAALMPRHAA